jgi:hypothetical protein
MKFENTNICNFTDYPFGSVDGHSKLKVPWNLQLRNYKSASLGIIVFWEQSNYCILGTIQSSFAQPVRPNTAKSMQMINNQQGQSRAPSTDGGPVAGALPSLAFLGDKQKYFRVGHPIVINIHSSKYSSWTSHCDQHS